MDHIRECYCDSDSESDTEDLPELPDAIVDRYHLTPSVNMNRAPAGFNSFVYLEWRPSKLERLHLTHLLLDYRSQCHHKGVDVLTRTNFESVHSNVLGSPEPLHVSLSRSLRFKDKPQRDLFQRSLSAHLASSQLGRIDIKFEPKFQVLESRLKDTLYLTLPVISWQRSSWFKRVYRVIWQSLRDAWPHCKDEEIDNMVCSPESVHMTIGQKQTPVRADDMAVWVQMLEPHGPLPTWTVTHLKLDKNRESIKIPLIT